MIMITRQILEARAPSTIIITFLPLPAASRNTDSDRPSFMSEDSGFEWWIPDATNTSWSYDSNNAATHLRLSSRSSRTQSSATAVILYAPGGVLLYHIDIQFTL
ncbi:unnamed protein product [Gordionus sp. m RMFG-2023]